VQISRRSSKPSRSDTISVILTFSNQPGDAEL
jgi:hypothetical protein